ncbi:MAG: hypothetical protein EOO04_24515 [Chitinophagaceae bacterium]|nr:MAG: hypothetical protein EOO04_24515 [Chitinophagaceae bacterium]
MTQEFIGIIFTYLLTVILAIPLGKYIANVFSGEKTLLGFMAPVERIIFRISGINPNQEMNWKQHMKALLTIALQARENGKNVTPAAIETAKERGATDLEIHDTVLITALFCLYNRYVDGLGTALPKNSDYYNALADRLATTGYVRPPQGFDHLRENTAT